MIYHTLKELLLELGLRNLNLHRLVNLLGVSAAVVGVVLDGRAEQGVDEGRLAKSRLACDHYRKGCAAFGDDLVALVRELQRTAR